VASVDSAGGRFHERRQAVHAREARTKKIVWKGETIMKKSLLQRKKLKETLIKAKCRNTTPQKKKKKQGGLQLESGRQRMNWKTQCLVNKRGKGKKLPKSNRGFVGFVRRPGSRSGTHTTQSSGVVAKVYRCVDTGKKKGSPLQRAIGRGERAWWFFCIGAIQWGGAKTPRHDGSAQRCRDDNAKNPATVTSGLRKMEARRFS